MNTLDNNTKLRKSLELILEENLRRESAEFHPINRTIVWIGRHWFKFTLGSLRGFHLIRPFALDDESPTLGERWRQFWQQSGPSRVYYVVLAMLILTTIPSVINFYFQYAYDFNLALLREIQLRSDSLKGRNMSQLISDSSEGAKWARSWLKTIGSAHLEWSFVIQQIHLYFLGYSIVFVIVGPFFMKFLNLDYFSWFRWLLDERGECESRAQLTCAELARVERALILSFEIEFDSLDEASSRISDSKRYDTRFDGPQFRDAPNRRPSRGSKYVKAECESRGELIGRRHQLAVNQLERIALEGRLNPANRTRRSLEWLQTRMLAIMFEESIVLIMYSLWTYYGFKRRFIEQGHHVEFLTFRDRLQASFIFFHTLLGYLVTLPMTLFNPITAYDQSRSIVAIKELITRTLARNERTYRDLASIERREKPRWSFYGSAGSGREIALQRKAKQPEASQLVERLEMDLLTVLVQYRLFVAQYQLALRPFRFFGAIYTSIIFAKPMLIRSHSPYTLGHLKSFNFSVGFVGMIPSLVFFIPLCYLHQKCVATYKLLNSLVAQSIHFESLASLESHSTTLRDTLTQLKRELSEPDEALAKFSCQVFALDITYATLLRMIFWVALIMMPTLSYSKSGDDITSEFLDDPFGVYRKLNSNAKS